MDKKHRGPWAEYVAITWLLEQGYEVFNNVSSHGPIDIVAVNENETILIDVKYSSPSSWKVADGSVRTRSGPAPSSLIKAMRKEQVNLGVRILRVEPDGECEFIN